MSYQGPSLQTKSQFSTHKLGRYVLDPTGFLQGKEGDQVDLHSFLTGHSPAVQVMPINDMAMEGSGLVPGAFILVNASLKPTNGNIVVVRYNSYPMIRRIVKKRGSWCLEADNHRIGDIHIGKGVSVEKIGVVPAVIRLFT